jgi:hypothetical protein
VREEPVRAQYAHDLGVMVISGVHKGVLSEAVAFTSAPKGVIVNLLDEEIG